MAKAVNRHQLGIKKGQAARNWRKGLSATAVSKKDTPVRSIVYPIDMQIDDKLWSDIEKTYNLTNGIQEGSLTHFLLSMHLNGFCLFDSASKRKAWQASSVMGDNDFLAAWQAQCGAMGIKKAGKLLPSQLLVLFATRPRKTANKDVTDATDGALLGVSLTRLMGKDEKLVALATDIGIAIATKYVLWSEMIADNEGCAVICDDMFKAHGFALPSLKDAFKAANKLAASQSDAYKKVPLAWDAKNADWGKHDIEPRYMPHIVVSRYLSEFYAANNNGSPEGFVKLKITTANAGALSSLFNIKTGLGYLCNTDMDTLLADVGACDSNSIPYLEALQDAAKVIAANSDEVFDLPVEKNGRTGLQGRLDSWVTIYIKRLLELEALLSSYEPISLPSLNADEYKGVLYGAVTAKAMYAVQNNMNTALAMAQDAITKLIGKSGIKPNAADIETVEKVIDAVDAFLGMVGMLNNRLEQNDMDKIELPKWIKDINHINRFSSGMPDYETEIKQDIEKFNTLVAEQDKHVQRIFNEYDKDTLATRALETLASREGKRKQPKEHARRNVIQRIASVAQHSDEVIKLAVRDWLHSLSIFAKRDVNKFFDNKQAFFWKPVYSKSKHNPYKANVWQLMGCDLMGELDTLVTRLNDQYGHHPDILKLNNVYLSILLAGLPDNIPHELAAPSEEAKELMRLPTTLELQLSEKDVERDAVIRMFSAGYHSNINGLLAQVKRKGFTLNAGIAAYEGSPIMYAPKPNAEWDVPANERSAPVFQTLLQADLCDWHSGHIMNVEQTFMNIAKAIARNTLPEGVSKEDALHLLRKMPHDWVVKSGVKGQGIPAFACEINQGDVSAPKLHQGCSRLIGPSKFKGLLDAALTHGTKIGAPRIYFTKHVSQTWDSNKVSLETKGYSVTLHTPISEPLPDTDSLQEEIAKRNLILGIDLNKFDIGFALLDIETGKVIDTVKVKIKRLSKLEDRLGQYKKRTQPTQAYGLKFNTSLANAKEAAVAEIVSIIDGMAEKYNAIPIVEAIGKQRSQGGAHLQSVFEDVARTYTFSNVDAHKSLRIQHWAGGDRWVDDRFKQPKKSGRKKVLSPKLDKDGLELVPVSVFPGGATSAYRTSTRCSVCKSDPLDLAYQVAKDMPDKSYKTDADGYVRIGDMYIKLDAPRSVSKEVFDYHKKRNERVPYQPLTNYKFNAEDLPRLVRTALRRPFKSLGAKGSKAGVYHCLCKDCGTVTDSSINAAINIAEKWLEGQTIKTSAFENWDKLSNTAREQLLDKIS